MPTIYIDNEPYTIDDEGKNLLEVCLSLGFDLPYFCWHPAMHSVGACRQCAVKQFKDENDTRGRIVMACMTPAKDGARISIQDPEAVAFRRSIIEWLMLNHPHDCPVCDEGGECHLQDMTVMTGHDYRRNRFPKRTFRNQDLGPFVNHEMNRCIECYRCVRYYRDYAGGRDFNVFAWHDHVYFGRFADGVLESPFSGNLVEVCPTGVFTDKTLKKHYTRKWDLQTAPSICVHCGLGCNTIPGERYGTLRCIRNRYHSQVNGYFLCDRGRYGYEFVNSDQRLRYPLARGEGDRLEPVSSDEVLKRLAGLLPAGRVIGIGSECASLESNFALRALVGPEHFFFALPDETLRLLTLMREILAAGPRTPSLQDVTKADAVLILGEDVVNVAPVLALSLRQAAMQRPKAIADAMKVLPFDDAALREAVQEEKSPIFIGTPGPTALDELAAATWRAAPDDLARLGFAVAHAIDPDAPEVPELPAEVHELAKRIAVELQQAERPLVIAGASCRSEAVVQAAANVARALQRKEKAAALCFTVPACNSLGAALLGGGSLDDARAALRRGEAETVILLETDLYRHVEPALADELLGAAHVIALDSLPHGSTARAEIVLPAAPFAEADGTFVNNEGRAQRFFQVYVPSGEIRESWRWLGEMTAARQDGESPWPDLDSLLAAIADEIPVLKAIREAAPPADFRLLDQAVPRQSHRYSGRTAITANHDVHEPPPPADQDAPLTFSMEGYPGQPSAPLVPRYWAPGWNSVQALNKFQQEVGGPLRGGDAGCRLIEPAGDARPAYYTEVPAAFTPRDHELLIVPGYHLFGSEPLSLYTPGIADLAPKPYLALHPDDAERFGLADGQPALLTVREIDLSVPVRLDAELPHHVAILPVGLPDLPAVRLPAWGALKPADADENGGEEAP